MPHNIRAPDKRGIVDNSKIIYVLTRFSRAVDARKLTFNMIVLGPLILLRHTLFNCHNTISRWCSRPIKMDPLKKEDSQSGF